MKFTVVIEDWHRGKAGARLLTSEGQRCCIGFAAKDCGVSDDAMLEEACPDNISEDELSKIRGVLIRKSTNQDYQWVCLAYGINDDQRIDDAKRMAQLQALAIKHGHEFEFVHKQVA